MWIFWLIAAVLLVIIELAFQWVWTISLAIGCVAAMIGSLFGIPFWCEVIVMVVASIVGYILLIPVMSKWQKRMYEKNKHKARTGMDALLGRRAQVVEEIKPGRLGRARIDGDFWQVCAPGCDFIIKHNEEVVVTAYDSIILTVEPIEDK